MNENSFKTNDLNFAAYLLSRGWVVACVAERQASRVKDVAFQVPGYDSPEVAKGE